MDTSHNGPLRHDGNPSHWPPELAAWDAERFSTFLNPVLTAVKADGI
jgi:hypothetical protein